jgi:predicted MFS family arabinose efflux permease
MNQSKSIFRFPNFKKLYFAGLSSELGSFITETAIMMYIYDLSGQDKSYLGITRAVFLVLFSLGGFLGGPLGQRMNRKNILLICEVIRIPLILILFFMSNLWVAVIVNGFIGFFTGIFNPSRQTIINEIIPQSEIQSANALFGTTMAVIHFIGPLAGAYLYAIFKGINEILLLDLFTYVIGIFLLMNLVYKNQESKSDIVNEGSIAGDFKEGLLYVKSRLDLISILITGAVAGVCVGILLPLLLPYTLDILHLGEKEYGMVLGVFGLGGLLGGTLCTKLTKHFKSGFIIVVMACLEPIIMFAWLQLPYFIANLILFFIWGIVVFIRITAQLNHISETVSTKYLTRIYGLLDMTFIVPTIAGGIILSIWGTKYTTMEFLNYTAILFAILIIPRIPFKEMKSLYKGNLEAVNRNDKYFDL